MIKLLILYFLGDKLAPAKKIFPLIRFYLIIYLLILPGLLVSHTLNRQGDNTYYLRVDEIGDAALLFSRDTEGKSVLNFNDYSENHINCLSRSF